MVSHGKLAHSLARSQRAWDGGREGKENADLLRLPSLLPGYPTLKVFRKGEPTDYAGTRKADGIVSYMKKCAQLLPIEAHAHTPLLCRQNLPAVSTITQDNHVEFQGADKIVLIAYLDESDAINKNVFSAFAESHRDDYLFGLSTDPTTISSAGVVPPAVVMYKTFDEGRNDFTKSFTSEALTTFVSEHAVPLLDEISPENFALYAEAGIPLAYIFVPADDANRQTLVKSIEPIAREYKGKINFVWIDTNKFADHAKSLNLPEPNWPAFAIQQVQEQLKFPLPQSKTVDAKTVADFVARYSKGEIPASIKSQPVPKTQDEPVYTVVADSFEDVILKEKKKDIFLELYASWCGHCASRPPNLFFRLLADALIRCKASAWRPSGRHSASDSRTLRIRSCALDLPPKLRVEGLTVFCNAGLPSLRLLRTTSQPLPGSAFRASPRSSSSRPEAMSSSTMRVTDPWSPSSSTSTQTQRTVSSPMHPNPSRRLLSPRAPATTTSYVSLPPVLQLLRRSFADSLHVLRKLSTWKREVLSCSRLQIQLAASRGWLFPAFFVQ